MAAIGSASVPTAISALTRKVALVAGHPLARGFSSALPGPSVTPICRQMLRAARSFKNLNFRDYFVRRVSAKISGQPLRSLLPSEHPALSKAC